jgi:hypothetical protein
VLTKEKFHKTGAILEHPPHKSLTQLAQQAQVSMITMLKVARKLCLLPLKIRQVQATEEGYYRGRMYFCNWFLQAVHDGLLNPKLTFFTEEAWFLLTGRISAQNNRYWSSINQRQTFEVPLHNQEIGVWCAITTT